MQSARWQVILTKANSVTGGANAWQDGGGKGGAANDLMKLLGAEVVNEDMKGEKILDGGEGRCLERLEDKAELSRVATT